MKSMIPFDYHGSEIRTIQDETGNPWFVAKDVAVILGYTNPSKAINDHCKGITNRYPLQTIGGIQEVRIINEPDLYRLIAKSTLPAAEQFETWIFEEVLPSIRKTGGYIAASTNDTDAEIMARALLVAQDTLNRRDERIKSLEAKTAEMAPKALFADAVSASHTSILVGELAKLIKQNGVEVGQNRLFNFLRENGYLIKRKGSDYNMPTQYSMERDWFEIKERAIANPDGSVRTTRTPKITGKGQQYFVNLFLNEDVAA